MLVQMAFRVSSLCFLLLVLGLHRQHWAHGEPQVPCYFIFGDSQVDNGNNNFLPTLARCNYPPYGIDFPTGPTGRFTNGRTMVDVIAERLGFENPIPPFATARGNGTLKGVNYASGGAGIRDESGFYLGGRISLNRQIQNHQTTVRTIVDIMGSNNSAVNYLSKCIYSVIIGNNDYINNYFLPQYPLTRLLFNPQQYAHVLASQYAQQLNILYKCNARKIALFGLGQLGCAPAEVAIHGTNGSSSNCVDKINNAAQLFNTELKSLVDVLNKNLTDTKFIYINLYDMTSASAPSPGFTVRNSPCCNVGYGTLCVPYERPCPNSSQYAFWDAYHPTEALNLLFGGRAYAAQSSTDAYPYDISRLAQL